MWKGGKENSTPNKKVDTAPRKFPNPPQVITTPIKHFFKATPTKPASTTPSKNSFASPVQRISIAAPNRASVTLNRDSIITPTRDSVASNRDSIVVVHSPSFTALQKRVSSPNKSPKFKSPKSKSPKFKSPNVKSPIARESTEPRTPLSPKVRSVSTTPVHEDASRTSIDYYERIYNIGRPSATTPNKEVTLKQSDWHNMLSGLLEQVQEKDEQIADYQEHVEELEDKVDNVKRENILLRDEIREKNAEIARLTVTSGDKGELEALKERLNEVSNLALTQISQLKEFPVDDDREIDRDEDTEEVRVLRRELERAREEAREYSQEVERLSKKITHKNSQLKTYKSKVDTFLGALEARTTPSKNKRRSNGGWAQGERKKSRGSISGRN